METYTQISKQIGWEGQEAIPTVETALKLKHEVVHNQSREAFILAFRIFRFAPLATTDAERMAMETIDQAYLAGRNQLKSTQKPN